MFYGIIFIRYKNYNRKHIKYYLTNLIERYQIKMGQDIEKISLEKVTKDMIDKSTSNEQKEQFENFYNFFNSMHNHVGVNEISDEEKKELSNFVRDLLDELWKFLDVDSWDVSLFEISLKDDEPGFYCIKLICKNDKSKEKYFPIQPLYKYVKAGKKTIEDVALYITLEVI